MPPTTTPPFVHVYTRPVVADAVVRATVNTVVEGTVAVALVGWVRIVTLLINMRPEV